MRRVLGCLLAAAACILTLTACSQPAPKVSVQTGSFFTTISPTAYCFDAQHCRMYALSLPVVSAKPDATVLVDVPRAVVHNGWVVTALSIATAQPKQIGAPAIVKGSHSFRVASNINNGDPFIVEVGQLHDGNLDKSRWSFLVKVTDQT